MLAAVAVAAGYKTGLAAVHRPLAAVHTQYCMRRTARIGHIPAVRRIAHTENTVGFAGCIRMVVVDHRMHHLV